MIERATPPDQAPEPHPQGYPNPTIELLIERASCRNFRDEPIPPDHLQWVLRAGVHAATGGNLQPYSIIQIEEAETRQRLAELCDQHFVARAPVHLLFCLDWHRLQRWAELEIAPFSATRSFRHFWISFQDTIICAQSICTAADAVGLGSVYIGTVLEFFPELKELFELPQGVFPVVLLCLGVPATRPQPRGKLDVGVVVHQERYREMADEELLAAFEEKYAGRRLEVTEERLATLAEVCRRVHGEAFAQRCLGRIQQQGYISTVQRYFGLHYRADQMPEGNEEYLRTMREFGFDWFEPFRPAAERGG